MHTFSNFKTTGIQEEMSEESIRTWLVEQLVRLTDLLPEQIDITEPFASYGLDSVAAAGLSGELGNWLGKQLSPTITWDYPTVKLLANHLASELFESHLMAA